ncbi:MAG: hypothetical protein N3J91_15865 [Verrucomicrobiae bacterium]|nr:hypothetical protein [Verrucomicrobiae bacterium]
MSTSSHAPMPAAKLELGRLARAPLVLAVAGGLLCLAGAIWWPKQFGYSYLTAFMFFLSLSLGALFLVMMHHLFDSQWMVPLRRVWEHMAWLLPVLGVLFVPIALNALLARPEDYIYRWMALDPHQDHALHVKHVLFNKPVWLAVSAGLFLLWSLLAWQLRRFSLRQDVTGAAAETFAMRRWSAAGIFLFAVSLTLGAIFWMKSLQHQWFSTMYGVYYFAGSVWVTLATTYLLALKLREAGPLQAVVQTKTFHDTGVLFFAFTVFYAYVAFSQYFLIWNAAIPEETFWYVQREQGTWWDLGLIIMFGHFFLPFLALLRIDAKLSLQVMVPMCVWAWLMHYADMTFNIKPVLHPDGLRVHWLDVAALAFIGGVLGMVFLRYFQAHPPYPQRDPRIAETMGVYVPPASAVPGRAK